MQILLKNGGKTAAYECFFRNTEIYYLPDGRVKYKLGDDDMTSNFRCVGNLEYQAQYGEVKCDLLEYWIYFYDNVTYLDVRNKADDTFITFRLKLTTNELDKLKAITWK